jgi:Na+/melibiose symporter-like transporter
MMMFNLFVQQNQWVLLALLAGVGLTVLTVLTYFALWRSRELEHKEEEVRIRGPISFFKWVLTFTPWVLILLVTITLIYSITHIVMATMHTPNW